MSLIEELNKHNMACECCDTRIAEIFITVAAGGGGAGYSYCRQCAHELALSILIDYDKLNKSPH